MNINLHTDMKQRTTGPISSAGDRMQTHLIIHQWFMLLFGNSMNDGWLCFFFNFILFYFSLMTIYAYILFFFDHFILKTDFGCLGIQFETYVNNFFFQIYMNL